MLSQRNERHAPFSMSQTGQLSGLCLRCDSVTSCAGRKSGESVHFMSRIVPSAFVNVTVTTAFRRRLRIPSFVMPSIQPPCVRVCMKYNDFICFCQVPLSAYISITYPWGISQYGTNFQDSNPFPYLWCSPLLWQVPTCSMPQQNSLWVVTPFSPLLFSWTYWRQSP